MITTHVLDTSIGKPAGGVAVVLEFTESAQPGSRESWEVIASGATNADGRMPETFSKGQKLRKGAYRLTFELASYFSAQKRKTFYPYANIVFEIENPDSHYHVPLLLSGYGYSTYRGS